MSARRPDARSSRTRTPRRNRQVRSEVLRQLMEEQGWNEHDLAERTGLSLQTIVRMLKGGHYLRRESADMLQEALAEYTTLPLFDSPAGAPAPAPPLPPSSSRLETLYHACELLPLALRQQVRVREFSPLIEGRTRGFIGRQWIFDALARFQREQAQGYFLVYGKPGVGKTAFAAELTRRWGCPHHFNSRFTGLNRADTFLASMCAQLIAAYGLSPSAMPTRVMQDSGALVQLLAKATLRHPHEKVLMVVDALDEADPLPGTSGNPLALPPQLPEGSYILLTLRDVDIPLRLECPFQSLHLEQTSDGNLQDIRAYLYVQTGKKGIQAFIARQRLGKDGFVRLLEEKSQGNFMYLHYVLPELERGRYAATEARNLPDGLANYYASHWALMRDADRAAWFGYKLPLLLVLATAKEPVSLPLLADRFPKLPRAVIREVLNRDWRPFLEREPVAMGTGSVTGWKLYHASFADFLRSKMAEPDEQVDLERESQAWLDYGEAHGMTPD